MYMFSNLNYLIIEKMRRL